MSAISDVRSQGISVSNGSSNVLVATIPYDCLVSFLLFDARVVNPSQFFSLYIVPTSDVEPGNLGTRIPIFQRDGDSEADFGSTCIARAGWEIRAEANVNGSAASGTLFFYRTPVSL